jgi:hypothetical protein
MPFAQHLLLLLLLLLRDARRKTLAVSSINELCDVCILLGVPCLAVCVVECSGLC